VRGGHPQHQRAKADGAGVEVRVDAARDGEARRGIAEKTLPTTRGIGRESRSGDVAEPLGRGECD